MQRIYRGNQRITIITICFDTISNPSILYPIPSHYETPVKRKYAVTRNEWRREYRHGERKIRDRAFDVA